MALFECKVCGHKISDKAEKCVHCGCSISEAMGVSENDEKLSQDISQCNEVYSEIESMVIQIAEDEKLQEALELTDTDETISALMKNVDLILQVMLLEVSFVDGEFHFQEKEIIKTITEYTDIFTEFELDITWDELYSYQDSFIGNKEINILPTLIELLIDEGIIYNFAFMVVRGILLNGWDYSNSLKLMFFRLALTFAGLDGDNDLNELQVARIFIEKILWRSIKVLYNETDGVKKIDIEDKDDDGSIGIKITLDNVFEENAEQYGIGKSKMIKSDDNSDYEEEYEPTDYDDGNNSDVWDYDEDGVPYEDYDREEGCDDIGDYDDYEEDEEEYEIDDYDDGRSSDIWDYDEDGVPYEDYDN